MSAKRASNGKGFTSIRLKDRRPLFCTCLGSTDPKLFERETGIKREGIHFNSVEGSPTPAMYLFGFYGPKQFERKRASNGTLQRRRSQSSSLFGFPPIVVDQTRFYCTSGNAECHTTHSAPPHILREGGSGARRWLEPKLQQRSTIDIVTTGNVYVRYST